MNLQHVITIIFDNGTMYREFQIKKNFAMKVGIGKKL